jgi:hypothetical protein
MIFTVHISFQNAMKCPNSASGLEYLSYLELLTDIYKTPVAVSLRLDGPGPTGPKGFRAIA